MAPRFTTSAIDQSTLYRLVQQHSASFIARTEASTGGKLPRFIKDDSAPSWIAASWLTAS